MHAEYKKETGKSYLILETEQTEEAFSTQMLLENQIKGLLKFEKRSFNGESNFFYDISGMHSLETLTKRELLQEKEVRRLLQSLYCVVGDLHSHFLDAAGILTDVEYIYEEEERFCFCYYPPEETGSAEENLAIFAEQLLERIDHEDEETVQMVYRFYKSAKETEKGILRILEETLIPEGGEKEPEEDNTWYAPDDEAEEVTEIEEKTEKRYFYDIGAGVCLLISFLVSLCYLGMVCFPDRPDSVPDVIACGFALLSLFGIVAGFVDIAGKK